MEARETERSKQARPRKVAGCVGYILGGCWMELRLGNGLPVLLTKQAAGAHEMAMGHQLVALPMGTASKVCGAV